jgi:hypothetical protein
VIKYDDVQARKIQIFNDLGAAYTKYLGVSLNILKSGVERVVLMACEEYADKTKILFFDTISKLRPSAEEYRRNYEQGLQDISDYSAAVGQLKSCLFLVSTTFGDDVASKARDVEDAIKLPILDVNQVNELISEYEKILRESHKTRDIAQLLKSQSEFLEKYSSIYLSAGLQELKSAMTHLLASMRTEINIQ